MSQVMILEPPRPEKKLSVKLEALTSALSAVDEALACLKIAIEHEEDDYYATGPAIAIEQLEIAQRRLTKSVPNVELAERYIFRAKRRTQGEINVESPR